MNYNFKGTYDSTQSYLVGDVVSYQTSTSSPVQYYFCIYPNSSVLPINPSNTSYWDIINALSNFPNSVDSFPYRVNIQGQDKVDIARINTLTLQTSLSSSEQDELNGLIAKHRNKLFLADDLNAIQDSLSNLQMFFKDKVESYIDSSIDTITTTKNNALTALDNKVATINTYLDSTTAGALRVDIGIMGDLTTTDQSSLVNALNETRSHVQLAKITQDNGYILTATTDIDTIFATGFYYVGSVSRGISPHLPSSDFDLLIAVYQYSSQTTVQVAYEMSTSSPKMYYRYCSSGVWGAWRQNANADVAQMTKITADDGSSKVNITDTSQYLLDALLAQGIGFRTFFAQSGTQDLPSNYSIRGWSNITRSAPPYSGAVYGMDDNGDVWVNQLIPDGWNSWNKIITMNNLTQTQLWSGAAYPAAASTITPTKTLSQCKNGWILIWSDYVPGTGSNDYDFSISVIPKYMSANFNGLSHLFTIPTSLNSTKSDYTNKRLYIYDNKIVGHDDNTVGTNGSNASYGSNNVCLRKVIEF